MASRQKACQECGCPLEAGVFCGFCGAKQESAAPPLPQEAEASLQSPLGKPLPARELSTHYDAASSETAAERTKNEPRMSGDRAIIASPATNAKSADPQPVRHHTTADLRIEYNIARIFVEGLIVPFDFRITPLVDGIEDVTIEIEIGEAHPLAECPPEVWARGEPIEIAVRYQAPEGVVGLVPFRIYIGHAKGGQQVWRTFTPKHQVYRKRERVAGVIHSINVDFSRTVNVDRSHAWDIHESDQIADFKNAINALHERGDNPAADFEHIALPPVWGAVTLRKCRRRVGPPQRTPPPASRVAALTLETAGRLLHVIAGDELTVGRHRACTIVARLFDHEGQFAEESRWVSKSHCCIQRSGDRCMLVNESIDLETRARLPVPNNGTAIDGAVVSYGNTVELPVDRVFKLALARKGLGQPFVFTFQARIWTCGTLAATSPKCGCRRTPSELACLVLERTDGIPESFLVLWQFCPVRFVAPAFGDFCICREKGAFAIKYGARCEWLMPGMRTLGNVAVRKFSQWGMWAGLWTGNDTP
jgi:hypothetical protein